MLLRTGPYTIDTEENVVWQGEDMVRLPPRAIGVLVCLVEQRGNLTLKEELRARVWPGTAVEENGVAQVISLLRRELKAGFGDVEVIETVPRRGYRFTMEVVEEPACAPSPAEKAGVLPPEASMVQSAPPVIHPQPAEAGTNGQPRHRTRLAWAFGVIAVAGTIFVGTRNLNRSTPPPQVYPLTDVTYDEVQASISPDGKRVAYSRKLPGETVYDLYVKEVGGSAPLRVAHAEADSSNAAWSPDGQLIAYSRWFPDHGEVRTVSPLGRGDQMLVRLDTSKASTLGWSPDGKALAYSDKSPTDGGIFLFSMESAQSRRLTAPPPSARDRYPRFSADGKMLAFARIEPNNHNDVSGPESLYVMPTSGGSERRVAANIGPYFQGLTFTRAGDELVFASSMRGTKYLYRVPVSGGRPPTQAIPVPDAQEPSLARTMDRLVFGVYYSSAILWRTTMGKYDRKEVQLPGFRRMEPRISPDGERLAFVADAAGFDEVWVANVDGSGARRLTSGGVKTPDSLAWSPDGRHLAYQRSGGTRAEVWVVPTAGGVPRQLAQTDGENASPSWSGDGKWLYFSSDRTGRREIWRQPWPTGRAEQVTRTGGYTVQHSPDGKYLYFTKPESPGLFRMPVGGGDAEQIREVPEPDKFAWRVTRGGYYWYHSKPGTERTILVYDFATRKTRPAIPPNSDYAEAWEAFDVAPDDSWIIWPAEEPPVRRIMVGDGFR